MTRVLDIVSQRIRVGGFVLFFTHSTADVFSAWMLRCLPVAPSPRCRFSTGWVCCSLYNFLQMDSSSTKGRLRRSLLLNLAVVTWLKQCALLSVQSSPYLLYVFDLFVKETGW